MKLCPRCKKEKELEEYHNNILRKDSKETYCKVCVNENAKKSYNKNPRKEYHKEYSKSPSAKEYSKQYRLENKEKLNQQICEWYYLNKEKHIKKTTLNKKERKKIDPKFKMRENIRCSIGNAIKKSKNIKCNSSINFLGCNFNQFEDYIESQFLPEMNWDNHGKVWEYDHILPISSFDLENEIRKYECFNYKNIQPLFKTTKIAKSFGYDNIIGNRNKGAKVL